jgi:CubicO group peptidase (beta-lactamase class C family)
MLMKTKYLKGLAFIALLFCSHDCFAQLNPKVRHVVDEFGRELNAGVSQEKLHAGISAVVIRNGRIIWLDAFGFANGEDNTAADTNTIYRIGSITKTFTAVLLMQLVQEGKIKPDDPVERYLPEIKKLDGYANAGVITFRQLASHTSGLKREPQMSHADVGPLAEWEEKLISCIPYTSFTARPGEHFYIQTWVMPYLGWLYRELPVYHISGWCRKEY